MPIYAIIENQKVINIVVSEHDYAKQQGWVLLENNASIGWDCVNGQFINNLPKEESVE